MTREEFEKWRLEPRGWMRNRLAKKSREKAERRRPLMYAKALRRQLNIGYPRWHLILKGAGVKPRPLKAKPMTLLMLTAWEVEKIVAHVAMLRGQRVLQRALANAAREEAARQRLAKCVLRREARQLADQQKLERKLNTPPDVLRKRLLARWEYRRRKARDRAQAAQAAPSNDPSPHPESPSR